MRDRLAALAMAIAVAVTIAASGWLLLDAAWTESAPALSEATRLGAEAVGRALSSQIERALALGIPLDKLVRVEDYLQTVVATAPQVDAIALLDEAGRKIFATRDGVTGLTFPVNGGGQRATLVLSTESPFLSAATFRLELLLTAASLLGGVIAFLIMGLFLELHLAPARARLALALGRAAQGDFAMTIPTSGRGRATAAFRALAWRIEPVHAAARRLADGVATVRAIDFDGSLSKRLDPILADVSTTRGLAEIDPVEPTRNATPSLAAIVSRALLLVGLYAGTWPFLANFAIDRGTDLTPAPWWPVVPLLAEAGAMLVGAFVASRASSGFARSTAMAGWTLTGIALIAVFWCRSYDLFIGLRAAAGLGLGLALAPLLRDPRLRARPAAVASLVCLAGIFIGPLFGGLVAEAVGRRGAFTTLGVLLLAAAPFALAMSAPAMPAVATPARLPLGMAVSRLAARLLLPLSLMPLGAFALVIIPAGPGFDNYGIGSGLIAALGLAAIFAPVLAPALPAVVAGLMIAASTGLWLAGDWPWLPDNARWVIAAVVVGLGTGSMVKARAAAIFKHPAVVPCGLALGAAAVPLGQIAHPAAMAAMLPLGLMIALLAVLAKGAGMDSGKGARRAGRGNAP